MMGLQVISTGSFPIENGVTEEVLGMVEVLDLPGDGMEVEALVMTLAAQGGVAEALMMTLGTQGWVVEALMMTLVTRGGVAEALMMTLVTQGGVEEVVINLATVGPNPKEAAGMIG